MLNNCADPPERCSTSHWKGKMVKAGKFIEQNSLNRCPDLFPFLKILSTPWPYLWLQLPLNKHEKVWNRHASMFLHGI